MKYTFESRVRFSETGEDQKLTLDAVINYFQDCSTFQSEELGYGVERLKEEKRVWLLSSWQITVNRYPRLCEPLRISTWAYDFRHFYGSRNFTMEDCQGRLVAYANTLWVFMNTETGRPELIPEELGELYGQEEKLDMEYAPRKIKVPKDCTVMEEFPVRLHHLDVNHHVNNGQYIQMAREQLEQSFCVGQMRAEYKKQAVLGDIIVPNIHRENGTALVALCNTKGEPYAIVEFKQGEQEEML